ATGMEGVPPRVPARAHAPEELGKEIAEVGGLGVGKAAAGELEAGVPVRRRAEFLPWLAAPAELIVGGALLGVGEHGIGLVDLLHARFGVRLLGDVRVVLAGELAEGFLDVRRSGVAGNTKLRVVVL